MSDKKQQELSEKILEEYRKGNVVILNFEGRLMVSGLDDFIKQPADGILYDLNRLPETALTFLDDSPKWINDFAVAMVIGKLKEQADLVPDLLEALEEMLKDYLEYAECMDTPSGFEEIDNSTVVANARQAIANSEASDDRTITGV